MTSLLWLVPIAISLGLVGLIAFFWTIRTGQYEDPKGDASRILFSEDKPIVDENDLLSDRYTFTIYKNTK